MGLLSGSRPKNIGVHDGQLKLAPSSPNCVNSQSASGYSKITPIAYTGDGKIALARIKTLVAATPNAKIVDSKADYLYAEFTTKLLGFVDDVEFYLDEMAGVIQVRSASRLGHKDFGVNRKRIESIREAFGNLHP
jgi:uncharacterized protein (DUF1499 family)